MHYSYLHTIFIWAGISFWTATSTCYPIHAQDQQEPRYWKGNLHTHTFWSDGKDFPEMIAKWYVDHDYHFLALSDHNVLSRGEKWIDIKRVENLAGEDCLDKYVKAFGDRVQLREVGGTNQQDGKKPKDDSDDLPESDDVTTEVRLATYDDLCELFNRPGEFLMIEGEEISDSFRGLPIHLNATNLHELLPPVRGDSVRETIRNNLRAAQEQARRYRREILVHLNHPNFGWAITPEDLAWVTEEQFFEVMNGHPSVRQLGDETRPSIEKFWDIVNTLRIVKLNAPPVFGLGTDDSHDYGDRPGSRSGRAWVMVKSTELTASALIQAMRRGDFYSSSGVTLTRIDFAADTSVLEIEITGEPDVEYTTHFIGTLETASLSPPGTKDEPSSEEDAAESTGRRKFSDEIGQILETQTGTRVRYALTGKELYVRALITSSKPHPDPSFADQFEQAWTQPVGWRNRLK